MWLELEFEGLREMMGQEANYMVFVFLPGLTLAGKERAGWGRQDKRLPLAPQWKTRVIQLWAQDAWDT